MPEPIAGVSGDGYRVRVAEVNGTDRATCSDDFYLVSSSDAPNVGESGGPSMVVVEPSSEAVAIAGDTYTVEVSVFSRVLSLGTGQDKIWGAGWRLPCVTQEQEHANHVYCCSASHQYSFNYLTINNVTILV